MFGDLLNKNIQPSKIDVRHIPDIEISESLGRELQKVLQEEEGNFAKVSDRTAVVQTDKNYVFFSNQWLYLAVLCKKYAEELKPYGDFFDQNIRGNQQVISILVSKDYTNENWINLIPDVVDRDRMKRFIEPDTTFRPGKALLNGDKLRSIKDIFGSCILKKIAVPDMSSAYLGNLIYYLAKRPELYNALESEVMNQIFTSNNAIKLSSVTKDCAKEIIDYVYEIDRFDNIKSLFEVNEKNVKVDISKTGELLPVGNFLRYLFARPSSELYEGGSEKPRVFTNKEYYICIDNEPIECRLTTEWVDSEVEQGGNGNYLKALIQIVNRYYEGRIEIKKEMGDKYMYVKKETFELNSLPDLFQKEFSKRYITSLLAKPFVILTGNSGSGKTRISKQFAEYIECISREGKKNWALVPVGADWTDNAKVLGFFNPLANEGKGEYVKTAIVELIEEANEHKDIPYFVILDEMNLSHVERYFSDFLSHMETPDCAFLLDGYQGKKEKKGVLEYPDNLFVVGTVNIDETTYMFSPKVLDRANVIEFKPDKEEVLKLFSKPSRIENIKPASDGTAEAFLRLSREIRSGKFDIGESGKCFYKDENVETAKDNMEYVEAIFSTVYEIIEANDFEFAFRTVKEIRQYISAAYEISSKEESFDLTKVIDEQLLQKVLPKIHGNRKEIASLLEDLQRVCETYNLGLSNKKIEQMKGKLAKVQYASFI